MPEHIQFDVEQISIPDIMKSIDDFGMGFGCWLGEWSVGDGYQCREPGDSFYIHIYPTNEYVEHYEECEPWGNGYGSSFETALRKAFPEAISSLNNWIDKQIEIQSEEEEEVTDGTFKG